MAKIRRLVVCRDNTGWGEGWEAYDEDYDGAPDAHYHVGVGITQDAAIIDLLAWDDPDPDEQIEILEDA